MQHGNTDTDANAPVPLINSNFQVASGFCKEIGKGLRLDGITAYYHFYLSKELGIGKIAARRIPCACQACKEQLAMPWNNNLVPAAQPMFQSPVNCILRPIMEAFNDWKILSFVRSAVDPEEIQVIFEGVLGEMEAITAHEIEVGGFGAHDTENDYDLVEWTSESFALPNDSVKEWVGLLWRQDRL